MNVAKYIAEFLVSKNVRHVFGYSGGAILKMLDEMVATGQIVYIQNYHEQASSFAADAYGRVTDTVGVALATSGPGATNLVTGIANAYLDSTPTLFITGQDYRSNILTKGNARQNGFQDLNITAIVKPITKYAKLIDNPQEIRFELEKAYHLSVSGRPGAVLLDIPIDVQFAEIVPESLHGFTPPALSIPDLKIPQIKKLIAGSIRPTILVGGGIRTAKAHTEVREFAKLSGIPVIATLMGLDSVEENYGFAGLHGNTYANMAIQNSDLIIALGARFGQRQVGKDPSKYSGAKVVHVDIDENELHRIFKEEITVKSHLKHFLQNINSECAGFSFPDFSHWHAIIQEWEKKYKKNAYLNTVGLDPVKAVEKLSDIISHNAIITSDVGHNQMWVAQGFRSRGEQRILNSSGLGSMGFSLPCAIGAQIAHPDKQVICFTGDGGLQMNIQELMFIGHRKLPIKCLVFNNNTLGMMREVQSRYYNNHYYGSNRDEFQCVDLNAIATAYGIEYVCIKTLDEISTLKESLADHKPYIIELEIAFDSKLSNRYDEAEFFEAERINDASI
ncbi:acetolactate synthase-1/2/3 large subunit [Thalassospira sp. 11-3]|mgnify:FL=1|nr:Acetolactate synthase [Thalassospira sp. KO164]PXX36008.1 acetolactate synthase-1/2/3 large subunit [Thalassospira sp. 11-3]SEE51479.1 acetolactate synthase-1/2/3 large subunit [Thalassospira permensis]